VVKGLAMKKETIKQKITVPAKPIEVYEAFVDPRKHSAFTGSKATGAGKVGGKFTAWDGYISGKFLELEKGKRIVQEWITTEWPKDFPPSRFELTFKETEGGTEISMIHSDVPQEQAEDIKEGWNEFYWKPLKEYFKKPHEQKK
jgi:activator of HSP90 ATPase